MFKHSGYVTLSMFSLPNSEMIDLPKFYPARILYYTVLLQGSCEIFFHYSIGYRVVGSHSGVKLCRWTKSMLRGRGGCYKHTFYGIESHRCMETTPSLACANKCVFCWRSVSLWLPYGDYHQLSSVYVYSYCLEAILEGNLSNLLQGNLEKFLEGKFREILEGNFGKGEDKLLS